jgi:hypothetical protein
VNKLLLLRALIVALLFCLMAWDGIRLLTNHSFGDLPERHREILLAGALLWFVTVLAAKNSDDDWAGQF